MRESAKESKNLIRRPAGRIMPFRIMPVDCLFSGLKVFESAQCSFFGGSYQTAYIRWLLVYFVEEDKNWRLFAQPPSGAPICWRTCGSLIDPRGIA
jgi:hypothetical protein